MTVALSLGAPALDARFNVPIARPLVTAGRVFGKKMPPNSLPKLYPCFAKCLPAYGEIVGPTERIT